eukprot:6490943-Amphidinium_carterae.3
MKPTPQTLRHRHFHNPTRVTRGRRREPKNGSRSPSAWLRRIPVPQQHRTTPQPQPREAAHVRPTLYRSADVVGGDRRCKPPSTGSGSTKEKAKVTRKERLKAAARLQREAKQGSTGKHRSRCRDEDPVSAASSDITHLVPITPDADGWTRLNFDSGC